MDEGNILEIRHMILRGEGYRSPPATSFIISG